ncbi:tetratricopeptide repeat protein [Streptomyces sp. NPDC058466]|uniref:tetratricopeptide repeat protein n=1 Tax=Streptomyces sp. NPDC058466 TaxID=3346512 RepID=UPI00364E1A31
MRWSRLRPWLGLIGPLLALVVLTAAPAGVRAGELPWPKWLVAGLVAAAGVLVAVWTPLVKARTDAMAARTALTAEREAQAEGALNRLPSVKGKVPLVQDVSNRALLGIHEAIPLPADSAVDCGLSAELPTYVPRDIDADLRTTLEAHSKTGGFILLVGPAASGKTRCAYEAIRAVLPHWRLFMPGDAATVTELVTGGADLKQGVLWVNDAQDFLTGPDRLKASTLRRLLADTARPVILIGTIWPTTYDQLRTPAGSTNSESGEGEDLNGDAREVLELARRFSLGAWSDQEWERAEQLIAVDPRISQTSRHRGQAGLSQMLSAAPELIHRWEQASEPLGQAVITAAVVARRCDHPALIPVPVIEALAQEFFNGAQRATADAGWLADALTWACRPVHHSAGIAPLQAVGEAIGQIDGYHVSDILVDYRAPCAPISEQQITPHLWERLTELATPHACLPIGTAAYFSGLATHARSAWEHAASSGSTYAMFNLGYLLFEQGDTEGARVWYTRAADAGHAGARRNLANLLLEQGDTESALIWYTRAADAGETSAMWIVWILLCREGDEEGAATWAERAVETSDTDTLVNHMATMFEFTHTTLAPPTTDTNYTKAMRGLGDLLHAQGDIERARTWWQRAGDAGDADALSALDTLNRASE